MKTVVKSEEAAMAIISIYFLTFHALGLSVWIWVLLFFSPDISMLGYAVNARTGAFCYNLFHHKGVAILLIAAGYFTQTEVVLTTGLLLFAHASFDRIWGYGLKYATGFKNTHLGNLEKENEATISR